MFDTLILVGLPLTSILLAISAPILAWLLHLRLAWAALLIAWIIWPALLVIGVSSQDAHGTGLHYVQLYALLALPLATIIAMLLSALVGWIGLRRNRKN